MTKDEALKLALEALTNAYWPTESDLMPAHNFKECAEAITAIKEALAQLEQEPVAYPEGDVVGPCICGSWPGGKCLKCPRITTTPQRTWVGLTDWERDDVLDNYLTDEGRARAIEAKLRSKNGY